MDDIKENERRQKAGYVRVRTGKFPPIRIASVRVGGLFGKKKDEAWDSHTKR